MTSILTDTKKVLGIDESYTAFDPDITLYINSVIGYLGQLGIGPSAGLAITGADTQWDELYGDDPHLSMVQTYVYLRVRMLFDPPATSFHLEAMKQQIQEHEFRLNVHREQTAWVDPNPAPVDPDELVLDGGHPWEV